MIEPERDFCLIHRDPESLCSIPCGECKQQAKVARAYGEQCRRAGAAAVREAAAECAAGFPTTDQRQYLEDSQRGKNIGAVMPPLTIVEGVARQMVKAILALPLPSAAEAASPAAGWRDILLWAIKDQGDASWQESAVFLRRAIVKALGITEPVSDVPPEIASPPTTKRARGA